jgi:hypothetical protein
LYPEKARPSTTPEKNPMRKSIHTLPNQGATNDWLTPPGFLRKLGTFDLDPCAHPKQFYRTAQVMIAPPADGIESTWEGRVWLNPPYGGQIALWLEKMALHGNGVALVPARTEVESWFWPFIWERADALLFLRGRLYYHRPDGSLLGNAGHGSVLVAYGPVNVDALRESKIVGRFVPLD